MKRSFSFCLAAALLLAATVAGAAPKSEDYYQVYSGELTTLNYLVTAGTNEHEMIANVLDGLVEYDKYGVLVPSLATDWTNSADGKTWTFTLRKGVKWVDNKGKDYAEVVAQDWVDAARYLFDKKNASLTANIAYTVIKNGKAFFEGKVTDFSQVGVKALDKYTLQYTLEKPVPYFLSMLTYVCFLPANGQFIEKAGTRFGTDNKTILYNGAYIIETFEPQVGRTLVRNDKYWDKEHVYIRRLIYKYNKESGTLGPELFLRGEISSIISIPSSLIDSWMKDPAKKAIIRPLVTNSYTYFYALNFNATFDAQYDPDNWKVAVNNKNFRKALFHALDKRAAMLTSEPYAPERRLQNTITPRNFVNASGKDYVDMADLAKVAKADSFNKILAAGFKAKAMAELAGTAKFPVKIMMPYNAGMSDWTNRAQVVEQQLENLLGNDFIDVIPVSFPATGFLGATRRKGNYAILECNWGPDYADPETYTDPFITGSNYNWPEKAVGYAQANGKSVYENMVDAAKAEVVNIAKRYELFAKAEAYFIDEAFVIPYAIGGGGFTASKLEPFSYPFAPFGTSTLKFKGQTVMQKPLSTEAYNKMKAAWDAEREEALKKSKY
ncbi:MAG TPA: peptide ABC transporter substrate-binding protein [Rectinemataceae bacterium]|nr:peptide ABC transporter substrate-binding protein [Rectinemataceae bacterium]